MLTKVQQFMLVLVCVFIATAGVQFMNNVTNVFATDLTTWQIIINSGIMGVVAYIVAWLVPQNRAFGLGKSTTVIVKGS